MTMKRHVILLICLLGFAYTHASSQPGTAPVAVSNFQSHQIITSGTLYQGGATYSPFDNAAPSDYSAVGSRRAPGPGGTMRRAFDTGAEYDKGPSPIGEPWILLAFAVAFAGVIAWRHKRHKI